MVGKVASTILDFAAVETGKTILRVYHGTRKWLGETITSFEPTPARTLLNHDLFSLRQYRPRKPDPTRYPIVLIPPLMVKPDVYDLSPERSFIRFLVERGYDLYMVDFGVPTERHDDIGFDHYIGFIDTAIKKVKRHTKSDQVTLIGYCLGGVFANIYVVLDRTKSVRNIVAIGAPLDFNQMPGYTQLARLTYPAFDVLAERRGSIPPAVPRAIFNLLQPVKTMLRPVELWWNLWDEEFLASYEAVERWFNDFVPLTKKAFREFFGDIVRNNRLYMGELRVLGQPVKLSKITTSYLALAGKNDMFVEPACAAPIVNVISSRDKRFEVVGGGHLGVLVGSSARPTWEMIARWLEPRGRSKRQEARGKRQEARGKRQEARSKRQEARSKRQEARSKRPEAGGH